MIDSIIFSLFLLLFASCNQKIDPVDRSINGIISSTNTEIENRYPTKLRGIGIRGMHGVHELTLNFSIRQPLSVNEARAIIVDCSKKFLKNINANTILRPYLAEFPFPPSRIHLFISIDDGSLDPIRTPGTLMSISLSEGIIKYQSITEKGTLQNINQIALLQSETFEEAKRIVDND